ncbi:hypothetical protein B0H19DRAFT_1073424 [Mycena capillaripes]|nr:hypothetical protein B0H19DRAFT_1073424 [Mycena capillaripes]
MKFFSSFSISLILAGSAFAQGIGIGAPLIGTTIKVGSNITVQVNGEPVKQGTIEAAVVIGLLSCSSPCPSPKEQIGQILYNGPYFPTIHFIGPGPAGHPSFENLTVAIPASTPAGPAQLSVTQANILNDGSHFVLTTSEVMISVE